MEHKPRVWELIAKRLSGALTALEQAELDALLAADQEVAQQQQLLEKASFVSDGKLNTGEKELMLDRIMENIAAEEVEPVEAPTKHRWRRLLVAAALCLLLAGTGIFGYMHNWSGNGKENMADWSTVQTKPGSKTRITLPDGTLVVLNAGSILSYPNDFAKTCRQVKLSGEGYFDVVKMAEHPFIIHTQTLDVKVLGTIFNVRAYADEPHTETALISGGVEVTVKGAGKQRITLSPHQKLLVANTITQPEPKHHETVAGNTKSLIVLENLETDHTDSLIQETAWIDNKFVYRNENFSQLIKRIERWYGVTVECSNQQLLNSPFTGNVQQESLDQLLRVLQQTKHFGYNISAGRVVIY